jgi:hypothetical protein
MAIDYPWMDSHGCIVYPVISTWAERLSLAQVSLDMADYHRVFDPDAISADDRAVD